MLVAMFVAGIYFTLFKNNCNNNNYLDEMDYMFLKQENKQLKAELERIRYENQK